MTSKEEGYRLLETRPRFLAQKFRESRDRWKAKCQESKAMAKKLRDRIRDLELSRCKWRDEAEDAIESNKQLQDEIDRLRSELMVSAEEIATAEQRL